MLLNLLNMFTGNIKYVCQWTFNNTRDLSILELTLSFPGALLLVNLCIIQVISLGVTGQQNILFLHGFRQYLLKSDIPTNLSDCTRDGPTEQK